MSPILNNDMKTYIRHITLTVSALLAALVLAASCARDERDLLPADMIPLADLELSWQVEDPAVYTKAGQSVLVENQVFNLYIMLFNETGTMLHHRSYYVGTSQDGYDDVLTSYSNKDSEDGAASRGTIPNFFTDFSSYAQLGNQSLTFCAVANYNPDNLNFDDITLSGLENMTVSIAKGDVSRSAFTMVAKEDNVRLNVVNDEVERVGVNLNLRRLDAKLSFNLTVDIKEAIGGTVAFENMRYRVHNVPYIAYLFEKDKGSGPDNDWDAAAAEQPAAGETSNFSCMYEDNNYETFDEEFSGGRVGGTFAFYLRENRPVPKQQITAKNKGDYSSLYAMREAWEGNEADKDEEGKTPVHGRNFIYAPRNATFVEITGELSYQRPASDGGDEPDNVRGEVTYIIHLGETGNDPNNEETVNNYDVRRNVRYIYNVRITGINNMVVEVSEDKEQRPGVEGDLIVSSQDLVTFDAHYGRVLLRLSRASLLTPGWNADTPLGTVSYNSETGEITSSSNAYDYKWVLFAINKHFPTNNGMGTVGNDEMVKFPGIDAYDGGVRFYEGYNNPKSIEEIKASIAEDYGNSFEDNRKFKDRIQGTDNYYFQLSGRYNRLDEDACLRDINQLINYLKKEALDENSDLFEDGKVYVTAFCDEFTYIYDPRYEDYVHPGTSVGNMGDKERRLALWKEYVNAAPRTINITPMVSTEHSQDGNTSVTYSEISITQNSIKTIYDPANVPTAWGLETVNETGRLKYDATHSAVGGRRNTTSDGRTNFLNFWIPGNENSGSCNTDWTSVMTVTQDVENAQGLKDEYRDVYHACITRNRDLNGNNKIDADEIFWYLAAKDQLSGLYIGQPALDQDAWMYQPSWINDEDRRLNHLVTSTHGGNGNWDNFWILWSEEGASWGLLSGDENGKQKNEFDYRCIRNLGIDIADAKAPQHYAEVTELIDPDGSTEGWFGLGGYESGDEYHTITVDAINTLAIRTYSDAESKGENDRYVPFDNERGQNNRPYSSFDVRKVVVPSGLTWLQMQSLINSNGNPCPNGWRVPNQREFLIMMSLQDDIGLNDGRNGKYLGIATYFSFKDMGGYDGTRHGFMYDGSNLVLIGGPSFGITDDDGYPVTYSFRCVRDHID